MSVRKVCPRIFGVISGSISFPQMAFEYHKNAGYVLILLHGMSHQCMKFLKTRFD